MKTYSNKLSLLLVFTSLIAHVLSQQFIYPTRDLNVSGDRDARPGEVPHQLSLQQSGGHICSAALVQVDTIQFGVTAAHCILNSESTWYDVVAGETLLSKERFDPYTGFPIPVIAQTRHVERVLMHPNFTSYKTIENDIAILLLNATFRLNSKVKPIPLPTQGQTTTHGFLNVSGWITPRYQQINPDDLHTVRLPIVGDLFCREAYENNPIQYVENMICAGRFASDIGTCHVDAGGPAVSDAGYLAGITSWGHECTRPYYPAVFTEVSHFVDWIQQTVRSSTTA